MPKIKQGPARNRDEILREATRLADAGKLSPRLDPRRLALEGIADAYAAVKDQSAAGKIAIDIE